MASGTAPYALIGCVESCGPRSDPPLEKVSHISVERAHDVSANARAS